MPEAHFRVYAQPPFIEAFREPVELVVQTAGGVRAGPADERFAVVHAPRKRRAWRASRQDRSQALMPYARNGFPGPPAEPDADGNFHHIDPADDTFRLAHTFAIATHAVNVWDRHLAAAGLPPVQGWYHAGREGAAGPAVEVLVDVQRDGASSAFGFIEMGTGMRVGQFRHRGPICLQADIIAHEVGHQILFATLGFPSRFLEQPNWAWYSGQHRRVNGPFVAFHESFGDLLAWLCSLELAPVRAYTLDNADADGTLSRVATRIGDFPDARQGAPLVALRNIGTAAGTVAGIPLDDHGLPRNPELSRLLSGAVHEVFLDLYEQQKARAAPDNALVWARDRVGLLLAAAVGGGSLTADGFGYARFERALVDAAARHASGDAVRLERCIRAAFRARGLGD